MFLYLCTIYALQFILSSIMDIVGVWGVSSLCKRTHTLSHSSNFMINSVHQLEVVRGRLRLAGRVSRFPHRELGDRDMTMDSHLGEGQDPPSLLHKRANGACMILIQERQDPLSILHRRVIRTLIRPFMRSSSGSIESTRRS